MKIELSEKAKIELEKIFKSNNNENPFRISIMTYNCGGPVFDISLEEKKENDQEHEVEGIKFIVEDDILILFKEFYIDYHDESARKGFSVKFGKDSQIHSCQSC